MDAERWNALKATFEELLDLPSERRRERLATLASTDPQLSEQLARLLAADAITDRRLHPLESPAFPPPAGGDRPVPDEAASGLDSVTGSGATSATPDPFHLSGCTVSHFQVREVLGRGGMGVVYRAEDLRLGRTVALKFLLPQYTLDAAAKERFLNEARAASALDHPHICTIHQVGETEGGQLFLAMGCYEGQTLRTRLAREGTLPWRDALALVAQVLRGLRVAHQAGIVHRDLKPGNLMLTPDAGVKILDFGVAKVRDVSLTGWGGRPGTVAYMSPEQVQGERVDGRSDLWSLGVVLYEMLCGRTPFGGGHELSTVYRILHEAPPALSILRPEIPAEVEAIVFRLLEKKPERRYASAAHVIEALAVGSPASRSAPCISYVGSPRRSTGRRVSNLPAQPTPLIGRRTQILEVRQFLERSDVRLLTLTGPGGTGKTRLAVQVATELTDAFADGVYFVNLAPLTDSALMPSAIAQVLGVEESPTRPLLASLQEHLGEKRVLLLLDNFEHLLAAASVVGELLGAAPGLKVLATSRIPLHLRGEQEYPVPPLTLPDPAGLPALERLRQYEAVRLFLARAQAVKPDFSVSNENASAVAEICHRLDGLPLAIELAAARIRILSPRVLLTRLQSRLDLLTGGARDLPQRQQTLRSAIEWSYDLLDEAEKVLFRRLAIFLGGGTLEGIEAICDTEGELELDVLEGVSSLVEKNLLRQEEGAEGEPRFVMLETIHEYASAKLRESGEAEEVGRRHVEFFLELAEEVWPRLQGREQGHWLTRLEAEHENLRAALRQLLQSRQVERAGRLPGALFIFWCWRGHLREGREWLGQVLAAEELSLSKRARTLSWAANLAWRQQQDDDARSLYEESLSLWRTLEDTVGIAWALSNLGNLARWRGDLACAELLYEEAGRHFLAAGEKGGQAWVLNGLANIAIGRGDPARAKALYHESLALARESGDLRGACIAALNLGYLTLQLRDLSGAEALLRDALQLARWAGDVLCVADALAEMALVEIARGRAERAALLLGAAYASFRDMRSRLAPERDEDYARALAATRAALGESAWERLWGEGAALQLEEAIAYALEEDAPNPSDRH